ncbi:uncharacterized protein ColSpa_02672 [Colletotrichum spaethianum]|uniref:Uncharacterized protein n=1 Tax=Colletotrichum spaethianum TaxID=700344 RepID=A0AA37L5N7_9PEZI|nr:uncharacterized protein ColSpa_02672 [Colletotrichum spaethianum]GKT42491.1 hypothetical protein ColSpa_02672 [Colletotrichum spaethianum]
MPFYVKGADSIESTTRVTSNTEGYGRQDPMDWPDTMPNANADGRSQPRAFPPATLPVHKKNIP